MRGQNMSGTRSGERGIPSRTLRLEPGLARLVLHLSRGCGANGRGCAPINRLNAREEDVARLPKLPARRARAA